MASITHSKLISAINECEAHRRRLRRSIGLLQSFFPLTKESYLALDDLQIEHIDQFIYRFTKLQDVIGLRLYPSIFALIEQDTQPRPFLDILARLEKYEIVPDASKWQFFRNLRNHLAHEYPEEINAIVDTLNILVSRWADFEVFFITANDYLQTNNLLNEGK